jgi:Tol biopolymer transport system component
MRSRFSAIAATLALLVGCAGPTTSAHLSPTPTASPSAEATTSPSVGTGLPSFDPAEPLLLVARVTGAGGGIFVMRPDGTGLTQLAGDALPGVHKHPDWSPDGQRIVFMDDTSERMWIAHVDGSPSTSVSACETRGCDYPAWSPDGKMIAFSRYENGPMPGPAALAIFILELATGDVTHVVRLERPILADVPRWSPDGTQLVIQVDEMDDQANETGAALAIVPVTGGEPRYLTEFEAFASSPDWGLVTDEIVFAESLRVYQRTPDPADRAWNLFAIEPDGSGLRQITSMPPGRRMVAARWTPDGQHLVAKEYDDIASGGRLVDPATGTFEPFVTDELYSVPLPRPLDRAD